MDPLLGLDCIGRHHKHSDKALDPQIVIGGFGEIIVIGCLLEFQERKEFVDKRRFKKRSLLDMMVG